MIPRTRTLIGVAAASLFVATGSAVAQAPAVRVQEGALTGVHKGPIDAFLGVPYAAPPIGANRWKPPLAPATWAGVRKADTIPASCQQGLTPQGFGPWTHEYVVTNQVSEDCLYLNVWAPAKHGKQALPVMVWIHGGGFSSGSASVPIYDGSALAAKGIIVIGINYRVGLYGYMAHPELTAESPAHASGNYGLLDQIAALKWIKANVAAFGGDPSKITIAGQSAGAASVHHIISSPLARGLFARAIAESGSGMGLMVPDRATAEQAGLALTQAAGVSSVADLRKLSPSDLEAAARKSANPAAGGLAFAPIVDGLAIPDARTVGANTNDTPILTGMTADEMKGLNPAFGKATPASLRAEIAGAYGSFAEQVSTLYPASSDVEANASSSALATDRGLASMSTWADLRQLGSKQPIYAYLWTHAEPGPDAARYGAFHSSEIPYVFATLDKSPERPFTEIDDRLADQMSSYWANWVKKGDPNGPGLPLWPRYSQATREILVIDARSEARPVLPPAKLRLFQQFVKQGGRLSLL